MDATCWEVMKAILFVGYAREVHVIMRRILFVCENDVSAQRCEG